MTNAPLPSPFDDSSQHPVITRRLEWDEEKGCFVFYFLSGLKARLRCEWVNGLRNPYAMLGVLMFPVFLPLMLLTQAGKSKQRPDKWEIYPWGVIENYDVRTSQMRWFEIRRVIQRNGDLFLVRAFYQSGFYLTREDFCSNQECDRMEQLIRLLHESQGQDWEEAKQRFKTR